MKPSRRVDSENVRRDSRDRDTSHASGSSRFSRKRPSMLSEFHGKHYSHTVREGDRESSLQHYRPHSRYSHETASGIGGTASGDHTPSGAHSSKSSKIDSRSRHSRHPPHRPTSHHHYSNSHHHNTNFADTTPEDEAPVKRPRLMVDVTRKLSGHSDSPGSADSVNSSLPANRHSMENASPWMSTYHLEDIDSDDDDSLLREESDKKRSKSPTPVPTGSPEPLPPSSPTPQSTLVPHEEPSRPQPLPLKTGAVPMPSKEELLIMMERVDRDIAAAETQISVLQKKRAELEENARTTAGTPHSSTFSSLPSPTTPLSDHASATLPGEDTPLPSPSPPSRLSPKKSLLEAIYSENRTKSRSAQNVLSSASVSLLPGLTALYHQPCEAPPYYHNLSSHQAFRPKLVQHIRRRKLNKHKKELQLCEEYDTQMTRWERSVERMESNPKKKVRDQKNRELFERCFPELKAKREHQERMTRVDQRGYGIVRSDAELKEIMYELNEQEEAPVRYRRTHATIPPMLVGESERKVEFVNNNGLVSDPMALHRDSRFISVWSEEEKTIFRDKYMFYPKNFEVISSFLPNKSPAECVQHYYLSKKLEKYKHMVRKANLKRKKPFVKPSEFPNPPLTPPAIPPLPISLFTATKPKTEDGLSADEDSGALTSEFGDWSQEEISSLKEGLRKYGRAWGKIYREVGGLKTATQCKQFYDKYCSHKQLDLLAALAEHSSMKSAEKLRRKVESRKPATPAVSTEAKRKGHQKSLGSGSGGGGGGGGSNKPSPLHSLSHTGGSEELDSENTASVYDSDSNSEDSSSESTITDSSPEDASSSSAFAPSLSSHPLKPSRAKKPKLLSTSSYRRTSEEALDLFISAAEALNNIIPPEVALHDHTYALPPTALVNNMDLQGTSGLSLIAAAAAVVSPTLSKSAGSSKIPSLSPVRAPRGRPPNSQRKGMNSTSCKLAPTLLSPAGTSPSVLLTEMKAAPLRGRARSAPSDRPKVSTLHVPRPGSTLARMSLNSSNRSIGNRGSGIPTPSPYPRHKDSPSTAPTTGSKSSSSSSSLKSMIAFHTSSPSSHSHTPSPPTSASNGKSSSTNPTSAFEALVNVAVAAPPAELPHSSVSAGGSHSKSSSPVSTPAFTATPLSRSHQPPKDTMTIGVAGSNSNASNSGSTTTAYIDVNQAINILASLAQQQVSSSSTNGASPSLSVLPNSRGLFPQNPVSLLGNIMTQGAKSVQGGLAAGGLTSSKGGKSGLGVSATMDTLLGHLTSGMASQQAAGVKRVSSGGGSGKVKPNVTSKGEIKSSSNSVSGKPAGTKAVSQANAMSGGAAPSIQLMGSVDDLSNLNLLSSLVAAVAASQSSTATPTSSVPPTTSLETMPISSHKTSSIGQPSNLHSSRTEVKRSLESVVSALSANRTNSASPSQADNTSRSSSYMSSHTSTPSDDGLSTPGSLPDMKQEREDKMIAASSSIKKTPLQSSSSGGSVYGGTVVSTGGGGELPRSVVRPGLGIPDQNSMSPSGNDLSASLASIIPPYNPSSMSSQSSLLLYTRSLSFPLSVSSEPPTEEEDHLESATRGISELSKLLGTDNSTESNSNTNSSSRHDRVYKGMSNWSPSELLSNSSSTKSVCPSEFSSGLQEKGGKQAYLSSLLESQIHGTVHHTSIPNPKLNSSANSSRGEPMETSLDIDHSR